MSVTAREGGRTVTTMWEGGLRSWGADVVAGLVGLAMAVYVLLQADGWQFAVGFVIYAALTAYFIREARRRYRQRRADRRT